MRVVGVCADAEGHLVNHGAEAVLQDGVGVGQQGGVGGGAVRQVGEGVDSGGDVGVRPQRPIVPVPLFAAEV